MTRSNNPYTAPTDGNRRPALLGQYSATPPTVSTDGQVYALQIDANGRLYVNLAPLSAGADSMQAYDSTDAIYSAGTALVPKFAALTAAASGATTLIAAVTSKKIRVIALYLTSNGAVNVKFQSHVTPTDLTGLGYEVANTGFVLPYNPVGWFQSIAGEALDINLSASVAVGGSLVYVEV